MTLKRWTRVQVIANGIAPPINTIGRVVRQDFRRSHYGFDTLCVWEIRVGKSKRRLCTWCPGKTHLRPVKTA